MKLIHTSDWHLGQTFHGQERHTEHRAFLDWLLDTLDARRPDALLIAGDIFDVVNPSLRAQELLYDFIVTAHERLSSLDIVMIAGNHDSGSRIELPAPLMQRLRAHARGRVHWRDDGRLDDEHLLIPLYDAHEEIRAWCLALPFLRPAEVTGGDVTGYVEGISRVHQELIEAARQRRQPGQALIAMSHAHLQGASVSENSERPIVIGGEEALPSSLFPDDIAYVALGHLHRPQLVGEERIRYSGTPLPMDFSETHYRHQILEITLEGEQLADIESLPIPRSVELLRVGPLALEDALNQLEMLRLDDTLPKERWPWLEVRLDLDAPCPDLRARIEAILDGKPIRLLRIHSRYAGESPDADVPPATLDSLGPKTLFERAWHSRYGGDPGQDILQDFHHLWQTVQDDEELEG